ncbi:glycosyltransferase family 4 protein, partial [Patescibacteria group bacterium]|nr:glycosyltransferase family 4 protein [Patescibacteria group bacterium]
MSKTIGINGLFLTKPFTGIGVYTINLLKSLAQIDSENQYIIVVPQPSSSSKKRVASNSSENKSPSNFKFINAPYPNIPTSSLKKTYWEQIIVPRVFKANKVDIAFFPYPANPCRQLKIPTIVTVHDTIPFENKAYTKKLRSKIYQVFAQFNLRFADKIVAVSNQTKSDLIRLKTPQQKIEVIHNTLGPESDIKFSLKTKTLKKFKITKPYFLYVGGFDERKNVAAMIESFKSANSEKNKQKYQLVLAGRAHQKAHLYSSYIQSKQKNHSSKKTSSETGIIFTDFISREDLNALYKNAHAFINFSLSEGFNLPLLEAAYFKTPIGTSDLKVHHEVIGEGAVFADPKN